MTLPNSLIFLGILALIASIAVAVDIVIDWRRGVKARKAVQQWFADHPDRWND